MVFKIARVAIASLFMITLLSTARAYWTDNNKDIPTGIAIRLEESTFNHAKRAMQDFLPTYIQNDMDLPDHYDYTFGLQAGFLTDLLTWRFNWTEIAYTDARFDISQVKLFMSNVGDKHLIKFDFPALAEWKIHAHQNTNAWLLPKDSEVELLFEQFDVAFSMHLDLEHTGFLKPSIYEAQINFGNSYFYNENPVVSFFAGQMIEWVIVMVENTTYFVGTYIFTTFAEPMMTEFLDQYRLSLPVSNVFPGQSASADFWLDYRNSVAPTVGDGWVDFYINGALHDRGHAGNNCTIDDSEPIFDTNTTFSQVVIGQSALSCMFNKVSQSSLGHIVLNEHKLNQFFETEGLKLTSSSVHGYMPVFQDILGVDIPLELSFRMRDIKISLGQFDTDFVMEYQLYLDWKVENGEKLFSDVVHMVTSAEVYAENDIMYIQIINNKISSEIAHREKDLKESKYWKKLAPKFKHQEYLAGFGFTMNYLKRWLNDAVLRDGIRFPYRMDELDTEVTFSEKQMHILLYINENAAEFLEDEFWEEPADWGTIKRDRWAEDY